MRFILCLVVLLVAAVNADEPEKFEAGAAPVADAKAGVEIEAEASQPKAVNLLLVSKPTLAPYKPKTVKPTYAPLTPAKPYPQPKALVPQTTRKTPTLPPYKPSPKVIRPVQTTPKIIIKPTKADADQSGAYTAWSS